MAVFIAGKPYIALIHGNRPFAAVINLYRQAQVHRVSFRIDARQRLALAIQHPHAVHADADAIAWLFVYANPRLHHIARGIHAHHFVGFCHGHPHRAESNGQPVRVAANLYFLGDGQG